MSATTTDNPISTTLHRAAEADQHHLHDYQVRLTTTTTTTATREAASSATATATATASNPPDWRSDYRGVPPYRPINTELDRSSRPWGGNPVGDAFVFTMLSGVLVVANANWLWKQTGGRINDRIFRYKIGGEI